MLNIVNHDPYGKGIALMSNRLCQLLKIRYPILQAGMVWVSDWPLVVACCQAGILGTLGSGSMSPETLRANIQKVQAQTDAPFAVNIPMLRPNALETGRIALEMGVKILITSAGNPARIAPQLKTDDNLLIHVVPSVRGAQKAEDAGVDAVVCEGYEAGGHNSPYEVTTLALVPQVADAVDIPVIGAGGIADGRGIAAVMALGADGVQLGTRFIATAECPAHIRYKNLIADCPDTGTRIIGRKLGILRVIDNPFAQTIAEAETRCAGKDELLAIIGDEYNRNRAASIDGDLEGGAFQAGQSAGLVRKILPVRALVDQLIAEYETARNQLARLN